MSYSSWFKYKLRCEKCGFTFKSLYSKTEGRKCPNCRCHTQIKLYHSTFRFRKRNSNHATKPRHNKKMMKLINGNPIDTFGWNWNKYHRPRKIRQWENPSYSEFSKQNKTLRKKVNRKEKLLNINKG